MTILENTGDSKQLKKFDCGDDELNDFFRNDAFAHKQELLAEINSFSLKKAKSEEIFPISIYFRPPYMLRPLKSAVLKLAKILRT